MHLYEGLNQMTDYIEKHLEEDIAYSILSRFLGCSSYTMQRIFSLMTGFTITEYIRRRRMSLAPLKLLNGEKGLAVALFCGYSSQEAFSRKFYEIYKVHPKDVKKSQVQFTFQPILKFEEQKQEQGIQYRIEEKQECVFYGDFIEIKGEIPSKACLFWKQMKEQYPILLKQLPRYAFLEKKKDCTRYWILVKEQYNSLKKIVIAKEKWLVFKCKSFEGREISKLWYKIYEHYLSAIPYTLKENSALEVYYEDYVELWLPFL